MVPVNSKPEIEPSTSSSTKTKKTEDFDASTLDCAMLKIGNKQNRNSRVAENFMLKLNQ